MKKTGIRRNALALLLLLISSVALIGSVPGSTAAGTLQMNKMLQMAGIIQQQGFSPPVLLDQPLFKVNVPLSVSNLPGPWEHAKLVGAAQLYFLDATGEIIGVALSEGSNPGGEFFEIPLNNGSYNGTVVVPIRVGADEHGIDRARHDYVLLGSRSPLSHRHDHHRRVPCNVAAVFSVT